MRGSKGSGWVVLVLFLIIGAVLGGVIGEFMSRMAIFADIAPYLVKHYVLLDLPPLTVDLYIAKVVCGLVLQPSLMSILGMLLGMFLYRRF